MIFVHILFLLMNLWAIWRWDRALLSRPLSVNVFAAGFMSFAILMELCRFFFS